MGSTIVTLPAASLPGIYTTYTEIQRRIANVDDYKPAAVLDSAAVWVGNVITDAQDEIDGRLALLYVVPFDPVPSIIKAICRFLACSYILNPGFVGEVPADSKVVDTNYKRANDLLEKIESGELVISGATLAGDMASQSTTEDFARTFSVTQRDSDGNTIGDTGTMETW